VGLQPLVSARGCKPGASPRADMRPRFQRYVSSSEWGSRGRRPDSYQPGALRQGCVPSRDPRAESPLHRSLKQDRRKAHCRRIGMGFQGPEARLIPTWRNAPGLRALPGSEG
jgi:hypothetical protein